MTTELMLGAEDWPRCRFTRSLLFETVQAVRTLVEPRQQQHHHAWLDAIDRPAAERGLPALIALNPSIGWVPDSLAPPPHPIVRTIDEELSGLANYPLDLLAVDLSRSLGSRPTKRRAAVLGALIADPVAAREQLIEELRFAWTALVAPFWAPLSQLIDADITFRSSEIGRRGLGAALRGLHGDVSWSEGRIEIARSEPLRLDLGGQGLALLPSAFVWPHAFVVHEAPWTPTLVYPARGVGALWTAPPVARSGLAGVLGTSRARLLADLDEPSTTTRLAARHGLSPAVTSTHLARLRGAALVSSQRVGKEVRYRRTPLGDALVRG